VRRKATEQRRTEKRWNERQENRQREEMGDGESRVLWGYVWVK
jgi:hypothetical protein